MEFVFLFIFYLLGFKCMTNDWDNNGNGYAGLMVIIVSVIGLFLAAM